MIYPEVRHGSGEMEQPGIAALQTTQALSSGQKRIWFLHRLDPTGSAYTEAWVSLIFGNLEIAALEHAIDVLVHRHEALRNAIIEIAGDPVALVRSRVETRFSCVDDPIEEACIVDFVSEFISEPFDLTDKVFRTALFPVSDGSHVFVLAIHHIACDGVSFEVMQRELAASYAAIVTGQPALPAAAKRQYADFISWQNAVLASGERERQLAFWKEQLLPLPGPARFPRMGLAAEGSDAELSTASLGPRTARDLENLASACDASLLAVVVAAYCALLYRLSGETDLTVSTPVTNRMPAELQEVVGFTVNTAVLRLSAEGDPRFLDFVKRAREACMDALENSDLPFEEVVAAVGASDRPLFQGMITLADRGYEPMTFLGLEIRPVAIPPRQLKFDVTFDIRRTSDGWLLTVQTRPTRMGAGSANALRDAMLALLKDVAARSGARLSTLAVVERDARTAIMRTCSGRRRPPGKMGIAERIDDQARRTPHATALVADGRAFEYCVLMNWIAAVQRRLTKNGVGPRAVVPVLARGAAAVVAMLAVLRAGGVFAPINPQWPKARIERLLARFQKPFVLLDEESADRLPWLQGIVIGPAMEEEPTTPPPVAVSPDDPVYIFSTSGSTGEPKCVVCAHGGLVNRFDWMDDVIGAEAGARVLQTTPFIYDSAVWQCIWPLTFGGTVVLTDEQHLGDGDALARTISVHGITLIDFVPSIVGHYITAFERIPDALASLNTIILGGERLDPPIAAALRQVCPKARIINLYGPTEATIGCIWHELQEIPSNEPIPIGLPIDNVEAVILDAAGQPCRIWQRGELYLGGICLALGYLDDAEATAARFIENVFPELLTERLFRTGDFAYRRPDGAIVCLGRTDAQIKIHGLRIDPGEIEALLVGMDKVVAAAVMAKPTRMGNTVLVAYVELNGADENTLRAALRSCLPREMIPARILPVEKLPTTSLGKIDRHALEALPIAQPSVEAGEKTPFPLAEEIAALFANVLGLSEVHHLASFFGLGGHSLLAMRLAAKIQDAFGVILPLKSIFENPTPSMLAVVVDQLQLGGMTLGESQATAEETRTWPMTTAQSKMFLVERMLPGNNFFVNGRALRLKGELDVGALHQAFAATVGRHALLNSRIIETADGALFGVEPASKPTMRLVEAQGSSKALLYEEIRRPFNLGNGPLFRALLVRENPHEHILLICVHHMIADAWSLDVVVRDLADEYRCALGESPAAFSQPERVGWQFVRAQQKWLKSPEARTQLDYWRRQLEGGPAELPRDANLSSLSRFSVGRLRTVIELSLLERLRALCRNQGCTIFVILLTGLSMLLRELTGKSDVRIGTVVSLRGRAEFEAAVGLFINMLVVRMNLDVSMSNSRTLSVCRAALLDAYRNRAMPFEWLVERLQQDGGPFEFPFNVALLFQQPPAALPAKVPGIETIEPVEEMIEDYDIACSDLDLSVVAMHSDREIRVLFEYKTSCFSRDVVASWLTRYVELLEKLATET